MRSSDRFQSTWALSLLAVSMAFASGCGKKAEICSQMAPAAEAALLASAEAGHATPELIALSRRDDLESLKTLAENMKDRRFRVLYRGARHAQSRDTNFGQLGQLVQAIQADYCDRPLPFNRCVSSVATLTSSRAEGAAQACQRIRSQSGATCVALATRTKSAAHFRDLINSCGKLVDQYQLGCVEAISKLSFGIHPEAVEACGTVRDHSAQECVQEAVLSSINSVEPHRILACGRRR